MKSVEEAIPEHINSLLEQHSDRFDLTTAPAPLPRETVFCNRELRMDEVQVIGFDYDYTIASYKWTLQALIYDQAKKYLLERLRYPAELSLKSYDRDFAIRGLLFDKHRGVLLKLSYAQQISPDTAFRGRRRLSEDELKTLYGEALHVDPVYVASHMTVLNDLFSLSEACLLADVLQLAIDADIAFDAASLGEDVSKAISWVHLSGILHDTVSADPAAYLHSNPELLPLLQQARAAGKQLFLLSNSAFGFIDKGLEFLVGPTWREMGLFDVIVTSAQKPSFYRRDSPFRAYSGSGSFVKWSKASTSDVAKGRVLIGGSLTELSRLTGWSGRKVLYVGDHLHADLREPRDKAGWATAAIVRELEKELDVMQSDEYQRLHARSVVVEQLLHRVQTVGMPSDDLSSALEALEAERETLRAQVPKLFNANFGSVFRHRADSTAYSFAVKQHVDLYTSRVEHLLALHWRRFYPTRCKLLPHDPDASASYELVLRSPAE